MSWPYTHLLINHFPVVLSVFALAVTVLALLLRHRALWLTAMGDARGGWPFRLSRLFHRKPGRSRPQRSVVYPERHDRRARRCCYLGAVGDSPRRCLHRVLLVEIREETGRGVPWMDASGRCDRVSFGRQHCGTHCISRRKDHPRVTGTSAQGCSCRSSARRCRGAKGFHGTLVRAV